MGTVLGLVLMVGVFVPAGAPDAGEVTFGLSLLTILGGLALGAALWRTRFAVVGCAFLGVGVGTAIGFVKVFAIGS